MNATFESVEKPAKATLSTEIAVLIRKNPRAWQSVCALIGLAGGVIAPILGAMAGVMTWFINSNPVNSCLHVFSIVLCALTIPLLILSAVCLDLLEAKAARLSASSAPPRANSTAAIAIGRSARQSANHRLNRTQALSVLLFLFALPAAAHAQQTVFNVPTTDVLDAGKLYFELDISTKPNEPRFSSFVPRVVVGVGRRVEVGLNVQGNVQPGADATTLAPAIKWKVYDGRDNGWAIAVGSNLFIPVRNKSYDLGVCSYAMFQKSFSTKTRVGFGGYFYSRNVAAVDANRAGAQFTFEQPVTRKLGAQADWLTGKHANGYLTSGGYYKFTRRLTGYAAYSIGNADATGRNHFLYFEVGYNFN